MKMAIPFIYFFFGGGGVSEKVETLGEALPLIDDQGQSKINDICSFPFP